jgi:hypothetical protein
MWVVICFIASTRTAPLHSVYSRNSPRRTPKEEVGSLLDARAWRSAFRVVNYAKAPKVEIEGEALFIQDGNGSWKSKKRDC